MEINLNYDIRKELYNGQWKFEASNGQEWIFNFRLGRLIWCEEKISHEDRLFRHLSISCPELNIDESELSTIDQKGKFLAQLYQDGKIGQQTTSNIISNIAQELLFDIFQLKKTEEIVETQPLKQIHYSSLPLINIESILEATEQSWQKWNNSGLAAYSPNLYPIIREFLLFSLFRDRKRFSTRRKSRQPNC